MITLENAESTIPLPSSVKYETRITRITVVPRMEPVFSEQATHIEIDDEAAGEFIKVSQEGGHTDIAKFVTFDRDEWIVVRDAIECMMSQCR